MADEPASGALDDTMADEAFLLENEGETDAKPPDTTTTLASVQRGSKFRKQLLIRIPGIDYRDILKSETLELKSWLSSVMNLPAQEFLTSLEQIVSKIERER
jgi:hypothetical protein